MNNLPGQIIIQTIKAVPQVIPYLAPETLDALKAAAGYDGIRTVMHAAIFGSVFGYLEGGSITDTRDRMINAVARAYIETVDIAYQDGGGELPIDPDTAAWARSTIDAQFGFIDQLFEDLKQIRKDGDFDAGGIAGARADGYASALDGFYGEAKMRGSKNVMLTWHLGSTEKHCKTCASLDGKSHKIQWYIDHDYIPRKPGAAMECGGWQCDCTLTDKDGNEYTV